MSVEIQLDSRSFVKGDYVTFTYHDKEREGYVDFVHANRVTVKLTNGDMKSFLYGKISNLRVNPRDVGETPFGWDYV